MSSLFPKYSIISLDFDFTKEEYILKIKKGAIFKDTQGSKNILRIDTDLIELFIGIRNTKLGDNSIIGILKTCTTKKLFEERKDILPPMDIIESPELKDRLDRTLRTVNGIIIKSVKSKVKSDKIQELLESPTKVYISLLPSKQKVKPHEITYP